MNNTYIRQNLKMAIFMKEKTQNDENSFKKAIKFQEVWYAIYLSTFPTNIIKFSVTETMVKITIILFVLLIVTMTNL